MRPFLGIGLLLLLTSPLLPRGIGARQAVLPNAEPSYWVNLHHADDLQWAKDTRLSAADLQEKRRAAGIIDDKPFVRISQVDSLTLPKHLILFVSALGSQPCLKIGVYQRHGNHFQERWSVAKLPDSFEFCQQTGCQIPEILATGRGTIRVSVSFRKEDEHTESCDHLRVLAYRPKGSSYRLASDETHPAACNVQIYFAGLGLIYSRPDNAERIVTLRSFGALGRNEAAIVIEKTPDRLTISSIAPRESLEKQMGLLTVASTKTPSECIEIAKTTDVERKVFRVPQGIAQRLVDELSRIDISQQQCAQGGDGRCVHIFDARTYLVQLQNGTWGEVTDPSQLSSLRSENPALSEWIAELLAEIDRAR